VKINILDEDYSLHDESIAKIHRRLQHTMRVLHKKIKKKKTQDEGITRYQC
jgi:hypothetical protein